MRFIKDLLSVSYGLQLTILLQDYPAGSPLSGLNDRSGYHMGMVGVRR
jgi:hypothetical protein